MRNALKAVGAALAIVALCAPLIFFPVDEARPTSLDLSAVTVTVPPTVVVTTTTLPSETTTTTTVPIEPEPTTTTTTSPISITVAAVGDVFPEMSMLDSVLDPENGSYDFSSVISPVAPYLAEADYTIASLETCLAGYSSGYSGDDVFNSPTELAGALKVAGIDLVATANSHSLDMGWDGVVGTLDRLDTVGLAHVGTSRSIEERNTPFIADVCGIKVAFLSYVADLNGQIPPEEQAAYAVNVLDPDAVAEDAMMARMWGADMVIAMLHYGDENVREPTAEQEEVSREILSRGVDVIIGSHPHMVQPIAHVVEYASWKVTNKYVAYSLGNFMSSQRERYTDSGLVAYVHIEKRGLRTTVTGVSYMPVYVQQSTVDSTVRYRVLPVCPGLLPETDTLLTVKDEQRMAEVWGELRDILYRPDEYISPINLLDLTYSGS